LVVGGKVVDHFSISYSRGAETRVLDAVYPKEHWSE